MRLLYVLLAILLIAPAVVAATASVAQPAIAPVAAGIGAAALDHPTRLKILSHLEAVPGDHFRSIVRAVQVSVGEARHHLNILMRRTQVREERGGNRTRYYVNRRAASDRNAAFEAYWALSTPRLRVLRTVQNEQTVRPSDVASVLGISRQLADYHLQRLVADGTIRGERGLYRP